MLRIGILTSGGDCQALNAAMRGVVKGITSKRNDVEIYGFKDGYKGLIKAINTFNPTKNIKLATYASRCIENEILMYLRRNNKTKLEVSIDEPLNVDWDGNELLLSDILGTEEDTIYRDLENEAERKLLVKAIGRLSNRERMIVRMRFGLGTLDGEEKTQKEVADLLGISQSYISRLEKKISLSVSSSDSSSSFDSAVSSDSEAFGVSSSSESAMLSMISFIVSSTISSDDLSSFCRSLSLI